MWTVASYVLGRRLRGCTRYSPVLSAWLDPLDASPRRALRRSMASEPSPAQRGGSAARLHAALPRRRQRPRAVCEDLPRAARDAAVSRLDLVSPERNRNLPASVLARLSKGAADRAVAMSGRRAGEPGWAASSRTPRTRIPGWSGWGRFRSIGRWSARSSSPAWNPVTRRVASTRSTGSTARSRGSGRRRLADPRR